MLSLGQKAVSAGQSFRACLKLCFPLTCLEKEEWRILSVQAVILNGWGEKNACPGGADNPLFGTNGSGPACRHQSGPAASGFFAAPSCKALRAEAELAARPSQPPTERRSTGVTCDWVDNQPAELWLPSLGHCGDLRGGPSRRTRHLARKMERVEGAVYLVGTVYNFCTHHDALRQPLYIVHRRRPVRHWVERTPAMAAGLTDHRWTVLELLNKVPPSLLQRAGG